MNKITNLRINFINLIKKAENKTKKNVLNNKQIYTKKNEHQQLFFKKPAYLFNIVDELISEKQMEKAEIVLYEKLKTIIEDNQIIFSNLIPDFFINLSKRGTSNTIGKKFFFIVQKIARQINKFNNSMSELEFLLNVEIKSEIKKINNNLLLIKNINKKINDIKNEPNSIIFDKKNEIENLIVYRQILSNQLNKIAGIKSLEKNNNFFLFLNKKIILLENSKKNDIFPAHGSYFSNKMSVGYQLKKKKTMKILDPIITTGTLGAILKFRTIQLESTKNKIGQLIYNFSNNFNFMNRYGYDINCNPGVKIFSETNPRIIPNKNNKGKEKLNSKWNTYNVFYPKTYEIQFLGKNKWKIKNFFNNKEIIDFKIEKKKSDLSLSLLKFDGIIIEYLNKSLKKNDKYLIQSTATAIDKFSIESDVTEKTNIAYFPTNNTDRDDYLNFQKMINLKNYKLINNKETMEESYENYKNHIQEKIEQLKLNQRLKVKEENILLEKNMYELNNNIFFQNLNKKPTNIDNLHLSNYKTSSLEPSLNEISEIIKIFNSKF
ncbi:MAG TPA: hypothetical protein VFP07_02105 [Buchnera sp. (in: enterobacteria)]|nr:hypothetical protein [Buchnera sp. (in: enterobacteria)]